jgi:hypothetical protein
MNREKGYSAYVFSKNSSDFCVIDQDEMYMQQKIYVNVGAGLLVLGLMFATPLTLVGAYDSFHAKVKDTNALFFVWSFVLVSAGTACVILVFDCFTIAYNISFYPSDQSSVGYYDVYIYFILFAVLIGVTVICNLVSMACALSHIQSNGGKQFPVPQLFREMVCCVCFVAERHSLLHSHRSTRRDWCEYLVLLFGCATFTLFLQLCSFHLLYIILSVLSTPVETLSTTMFYIACFFCLVAFVAIGLKSTNNNSLTDHYRRSNRLLSCTVMKCMVFLLAAGFFLGSAFLFTLFFYNYIVLIQSYRSSDGILAVFTGTLPSLLIALSGYAGTKLINCIKDPSSPAKQGDPPPAQKTRSVCLERDLKVTLDAPARYDQATIIL